MPFTFLRDFPLGFLLMDQIVMTFEDLISIQRHGASRDIQPPQREVIRRRHSNVRYDFTAEFEMDIVL